MSLKTILVPVERHDQIGAVFDCAASLGRIGGAYIEAVPIRSLMADVYIAGAFGGVPVPQVPVSGAGVVDLRRIAEAETTRLGLVKGPVSGTGLRYAWRDVGPLDDISLSARARAFDISVFGRPKRDGSAPRLGALEATLFEAGRPILIAPPKMGSSFGDKIVIAWNGSTETARAVGFAMPLLERAKKVLVLTVEGAGVPGPSGAELAASLQANGVATEERVTPPGTRTTGEAFLAESASWGADLVIKGAYTQSRLRQMIFGGATSHILTATELPVFMAH
jgi:nucleotide-binding universal stress UspA family protein